MNFIKNIFFAYVAVCLAACASFKPIEPRDFGSFRPGDQVEVKTVEGDRYRFKIDSVTARGISGEGRYVAYEDIKKISRKEEMHQSEKALLTIVSVLLVLGIFTIRGVDDLFEGFGEIFE